MHATACTSANSSSASASWNIRLLGHVLLMLLMQIEATTRSSTTAGAIPTTADKEEVVVPGGPTAGQAQGDTATEAPATMTTVVRLTTARQAHYR